MLGKLKQGRREHFKIYPHNHSYAVGDKGTVFSLSTMRPVGSQSMYGYWCVCVAGKWVGAHRMSYMCFIDPVIPPAMEINHIDGNKLNNRIENLELVTRAENMRHANDVLGLRKKGSDHHLWKGFWLIGDRSFLTLQQAKTATGMSMQTIRKKCKGGIEGFGFKPRLL